MEEVEPQFFLWCWLEGSSYCLKLSVLRGCLFPGPLAAESRLLLRLLSVPIGVSELLASSVPNLGCVKPKDNPGTSPHVVLESQCSLANLHVSLHLSESSYVCFKYNVQDF